LRQINSVLPSQSPIGAEAKNLEDNLETLVVGDINAGEQKARK
jgi:hypothetical protein